MKSHAVFLLMTSLLLGACETLPITAGPKSVARKPLPPSISISPEGKLHLDPAQSPAIPAAGPVHLHAAFSVPPEFQIDPGQVAIVWVNGKEAGALAYDASRLNGRRDADFDLTPLLVEGKNQVTFHSLVARGPNGKTTLVARVLTDAETTLVKYQAFEIDTSSVSYFIINETWTIDWHRAG